MSLISKMGRTMAAACTGEMTSDRIGTVRMPMAPNPPLDKPRMIIAGIAAA